MNTCVHREWKRVIVVLVLSLLAATVTRGATYYVDNVAANASDSNAGTTSAPWKTIQRAIDVAVAGDLVWVKPGIYTGSLRLVRSGTAAAPITFRAVQQHTAVIDGSASTLTKFIDWHGVPSGGADKDYIVFDGFEVRNCKQWAFWIEGNHNSVMNCKVHDNGMTTKGVGIIVRQGNYNLISSNEVYRSGWNGINVENGNYTTIQYNRSHDNALHFGINVFPNTAEAQVMETSNNILCNILYNNIGGVYTRYQQNNYIAGNVIYSNTENGIFLHYNTTGPSTYAAYTRIYNNTIVANGNQGIWSANATHLIIRNNILANQATSNKWYEIYISSGMTTGHVIDYNLYSPNVAQLINWGGTRHSLASMRSSLGFEVHGIATNLVFRSVPGTNYMLAAGSAGIDAGVDLRSEGITPDVAMTPRPQGAAYDMGAYEFVSGAVTPAPGLPPAPPMAPTDLHIVR